MSRLASQSSGPTCTAEWCQRTVLAPPLRSTGGGQYPRGATLTGGTGLPARGRWGSGTEDKILLENKNLDITPSSKFIQPHLTPMLTIFKANIYML